MSTPVDQQLGMGSALLGLANCRPYPAGLGTDLGAWGDAFTPGPAPQQAPPQVPQTVPMNPRVSDANVQLLGKILAAECGAKMCTAQERQAIGSIAINRMDREGTDDLADVAKPGQFAIAKQADPDSLAMASALLSGQLGDNTDGATNFYSPKSMPLEDRSTKGFDVGGGLEYVPGTGRMTTLKNYRPGWVDDLKQRTIPGVQDWHLKVYGPP